MPPDLQTSLRNKALLALEEAVQECRYRKPRRSHAIRFALAYLWALRPVNRAPFDAFWHALAADGIFRFGSTDQAMSMIYAHLGLKRCNELPMRLWREAWEREVSGAAAIPAAGDTSAEEPPPSGPAA